MDARNILPRCIHSLRVHVAEHACKRDEEDQARLEREGEGEGRRRRRRRRGRGERTRGEAQEAGREVESGRKMSKSRNSSVP